MYPMPGNWRDEMQIPHICQAEFDGGVDQYYFRLLPFSTNQVVITVDVLCLRA